MSTTLEEPLATAVGARRRRSIQPTDAAREADPAVFQRNLRASLIDGASFSVMVGMGETYFAAFVLALGLGQVAAGLVATLPLLAGAILQLKAPLAVRYLGSYRRWVVGCAAVQSAAFLPLVVMALWRPLPAWTVFVIATLYWATGMATSPAWNTWIGTIVPAEMRTRFFAWRTRASQAGVLAGFVLGGAVLQWGASSGRVMTAFALIFLGAGFGRAVSSWFLATQSEPVRPDQREQSVKLVDFIRRLGRGADGKLLLYLLAVQASVQISGPYFTPYMLRHLEFTYAQYMSLIAGAFLAKVVTLPALGQVAHRCGARRLMVWGGTGMVPLAAAWLVSDSYWYLMGVQVVGGVAWAAYELGMFLMFFEAIHEHERTSVLTSFNFGNALAVASGSLLGGAVLWIVGPAREVYLALFAVSSLARLASLAVVRPVPESAGRIFRIALRTLAVRPMGGIEERPILASLPQNENGAQ